MLHNFEALTTQLTILSGVRGWSREGAPRRETRLRPDRVTTIVTPSS